MGLAISRNLHYQNDVGVANPPNGVHAPYQQPQYTPVQGGGSTAILTDATPCTISLLRSAKGTLVEQLAMFPFDPATAPVDDPVLDMLYRWALDDPLFSHFDVSTPGIYPGTTADRFPTLESFRNHLCNLDHHHQQPTTEGHQHSTSSHHNNNGGARRPSATWVMLRIHNEAVLQNTHSVTYASIKELMKTLPRGFSMGGFYRGSMCPISRALHIDFWVTCYLCNEARSCALFHMLGHCMDSAVPAASSSELGQPSSLSFAFRRGFLPVLRLFATMYAWHVLPCLIELDPTEAATTTPAGIRFVELPGSSSTSSVINSGGLSLQGSHSGGSSSTPLDGVSMDGYGGGDDGIDEAGDRLQVIIDNSVLLGKVLSHIGSAVVKGAGSARTPIVIPTAATRTTAVSPSSPAAAVAAATTTTGGGDVGGGGGNNNIPAIPPGVTLGSQRKPPTPFDALVETAKNPWIETQSAMSHSNAGTSSTRHSSRASSSRSAGRGVGSNSSFSSNDGGSQSFAPVRSSFAPQQQRQQQAQQHMAQQQAFAPQQQQQQFVPQQQQQQQQQYVQQQQPQYAQQQHQQQFVDQGDFAPPQQTHQSSLHQSQPSPQQQQQPQYAEEVNLQQQGGTSLPVISLVPHTPVYVWDEGLEAGGAWVACWWSDVTQRRVLVKTAQQPHLSAGKVTWTLAHQEGTPLPFCDQSMGPIVLCYVPGKQIVVAVVVGTVARDSNGRTFAV